MAHIRNAQKRSGLSIRTKTASTSIFPENAPQNMTPFGGSNIAAGAGANLLSAPSAGKVWIIVSLFVSTDAVNGAGVRVDFTLPANGPLSVILQSFGDGPVAGVQLIEAPFSIGTNAIAYTSTILGGAPHFSIAGIAYQATAPTTITSTGEGQIISTSQDGNSSSDLG